MLQVKKINGLNSLLCSRESCDTIKYNHLKTNQIVKQLVVQFAKVRYGKYQDNERTVDKCLLLS